MMMSLKFWRNAVLAGIVVSAVVPMIPVLIWAVARGWQFPDLVPTAFTIRGWSYLASPESRVMTALINSIVIGLVVTLAAFPIAIPAARALGLHRFRGKRAVEFLVLAPLIVPELPVAMGIHILFVKYGLADTLVGVVVIHLLLSVPYVILVLSGVFANYQPEIEQSARTLGATPTKTFLYVTLPSIFPGIVVGGLFAFIRSWRTYIFTLMIGGGVVETLPLAFFSFMGTGDNHLSAVASLVFIGPAVVMLIMASRHLTGGKAVGGITAI
jgi:putative spermidine/putrescine transport system permease protein